MRLVPDRSPSLDPPVRGSFHPWLAFVCYFKILFGRQLPDAATARQGILAIFKDDEVLFDHFADYEREREAARERIDTSLAGESVASSTRG